MARSVPETGRRLRVLQLGKFYPPYRGGMETHLAALCGQLRDFVELEVLVANDTAETRREVIDMVPVTRMGAVARLSSTSLTPGFFGFLRRNRWDIVHVHLPNPWAVVMYLATRPHGQLVVTYHSDIVRQRVLGMLFTPLLHRFLKASAAIICTSPNYIESSPILRQHRERCHVVPFSIDSTPFRQPDAVAVADIRARHGARIVLGVGRLIYYKGFEHLVRAMRSVDAQLIIVGEGPLGPSLMAMAERLGLADRVTLLGEVESVVPYYHAADVFVLSSIARSEAFGLVQLEAMAAGVPVVNTQLASGVPYVSPDGVTGYTVPPGDAEALAKAINALLNDPAQARAFGEAARRRVDSDFSLEVMGRRTRELYAAVTARETAPARARVGAEPDTPPTMQAARRRSL